MSDPSTRQSPPADAGPGIGGILVGLGMITMAIFPFLIPGLATVAVIALPLALPVVALTILVAVLALPVWVVRKAVGRRRGRRGRADPQPAAGKSGARTQRSGHTATRSTFASP